MRNLIYKELKLAWHPVIYVFILVFPLMTLIPSYPSWIGYIYVCSCYPILFLGANKGQQSNDIIYTALLPVRKKDIVLARIYSLVLMLGIFMLVIGALTPLGIYLRNLIIEGELEALISQNPELDVNEAVAQLTAQLNIGLPLEAFFSTAGFALLAFSIFDYFFLTWFYRNGRSIMLPTLLGMFIFMIILSIMTIALPYLIPGYSEFFTIWWVQLITFGVCLGIFIGALYLAYIVSSRNLEKVNL